MIPVFDLKRQHKTIQKYLDTSFTQTLDNGQFILGQNVSRLERKFAAVIKTRYGVGVASGTDALTLSLRALGLTKTDEVIIPANAYPTAFGVAMSGVTIKLVDVTEDGTMDPKKLISIITKKTRAVIPVHLYGNPADVATIRKLLPASVAIIEDAAQAHGAMVEGKPAGSRGLMGCFSFYPSKNLGALGDGGMIVTSSAKIAQKLHMLRMYGEKSRYQSQEISGVSRLDELHAGFLLVKLPHLKQWVARRRHIAKRYMRELTGVGDIRFVHNPKTTREGAFHLLVIRSKKRDLLQKFLATHDIGSAIHYPMPIHLTPSFGSLGYRKGDFPISEALSREVLSLPIFPELTDSEVETVISTVQQFFGYLPDV